MMPDVHFGKVAADDVDWRAAGLEDNSPDDDEELAETPKDVVAMLGFDPLDEGFEKRELTKEYLDSVLEKVKEHLPDWLYRQIHNVAMSSAGGKARWRQWREQQSDLEMEATSKFNECHSPSSGEFCSTAGGGGGSAPAASTFTPATITIEAAPGTESYVKAVRRAVDAIPGEYKIVDQKIKVSANKKDIMGMFSPMSDSSDKGYVYLYPIKAHGSYSSGIISGTAVHEYGHAVDRKLGSGKGWFSDSDAFHAAWRQDQTNLSTSLRNKLGYHAESKIESFAEAYAHLVGAKGRMLSNAEGMKAFPNVMAAIKSGIADWKAGAK